MAINIFVHNYTKIVSMGSLFQSIVHDVQMHHLQPAIAICNLLKEKMDQWPGFVKSSFF